MSLIPLNYKLRLEPDLEKFSFNGFLELTLESAEKVESVNVNILELDIHSCSLSNDDNIQNCVFDMDVDSEILAIKLPEAVQGKFILSIRYTGTINDKMAGFYRSKYVSNGKVYPIAVTQFQESDARRAFPCFDHPEKKAVFDIELIIDNHLTALSNQDVESQTLIENNKQKIKFKASPKMSTYLVFWCVGEFSLIVDKEDSRVRVAFLPGMEPYVDFGLDFGKKALAYCEDYYGIDYPLSKLDLIAIPDFAFGAMENWGAITFRENLLLCYPGITSKAGAERIAEVISHEMAHQWFGNLVTPSDWKFLWLNESFATYFGFGVVDHYHPSWQTWSQFLYTQTNPALVRDAYLQTIPIEIPGGEHVVINTSTAPIIYCKGGSILRQIKGFIGDDDFKKGVRFFLDKYSYDCATSQNLWEAFESVSDKPVTKMMQSWIEQPGYPLLSAKRDGDQLILSQKRFSYQPNSSDQIWQIPVSVSVLKENSEWQQFDILMDTESKSVKLATDNAVYKINTRQTGFYRVKYSDPEDLSKLGNEIRHQSLPPEDRWGLENDLYAQVKSSDESLETYLNFLKYYENETDFLPLSSIGDNLLNSYLMSGTGNRLKIVQTGIPLIEKLLLTIGYKPQPDEDHTVGTLRDQYLWQGVFFGSEKIAAFANAEFNVLLNNGPVHPDMIKSIMQAGALSGNMSTFDWFIQRLEESVSEHDRTNILSAIGCFTDDEIISKVKDFTLAQVPARNQSIPIASLASNPAAMAGLWDWYKSEKDVICEFHPLIHERVFSTIVPASDNAEPEAVRTFLKQNRIKINPDVVELTLERLLINQRLKKSFSK